MHPTVQDIISHAGAAGPTRSRGFTLPELIVAVAAVGLLTLGIGQLFSGVSRLVGAGSALAETDQFARAAASQFERDFTALNSMFAGETFVAIRNRVVGDTNGNRALDSDETAVYLNPDERDLDTENEVLPYEEGSRALTLRLDEIMFLGFAGGDATYPSAQITSAPNDSVSTPATQVARIYYGHGLRPAPDTAFDTDAPPPGSNVPRRIWMPDGDFAVRVGQPNRFDPAALVNGGQTSGRNTFAIDWLTLRHTLLLYGGLGAGYPVSAQRPVNPGSPFAPQIVYTPYIRGLEAEPMSVYATGRGQFFGFDDINDTSLGPLPTDTEAPDGFPLPRLNRHGRVDLCAQTAEDVRRWLEGLDAESVAPSDWVDASAFSSGRLNGEPASSAPRWDPLIDGFGGPVKPDSPLWRRTDAAGSAQDNQRENMKRLKSAIAGCFARIQADSEPPTVDRRDVVYTDTGTPSRISNPAEALMDLHATLGGRISNFEIAWSDGKVWLSDNDIDVLLNDADPNEPNPFVDNIRKGDLIWYDMNFPRYEHTGMNPGHNLADLDEANNSLLGTASDDPDLNPEIARGRRMDLVTDPATPGAYVPAQTGADRPADASGINEYLAIFPFRIPAAEATQAAGSDGYAGPFTKPARIRIRMTVHDAQNRLKGGKQYEFQFAINPR